MRLQTVDREQLHRLKKSAMRKQPLILNLIHLSYRYEIGTDGIIEEIVISD